MLPSKGHEPNPTKLFQAVVQQNVRKWQAPGRRAGKYGPATIQEAQIAVYEVLGRLRFNTKAFRGWYEASLKEMKDRSRGKKSLRRGKSEESCRISAVN